MTEQRTGPGRRQSDMHCEAHEQNTKDISAMKAYFAVLVVILPIGMAVIGYYAKTTTDALVQVIRTQQETAVQIARVEEQLKAPR